MALDANDILRTEGAGALRARFDRALRQNGAEVSSVPNEILGLMDEGWSDAEIRARIGDVPDIERHRRQWNGEAQRMRAHARVDSRSTSQTNVIDGAPLLDRVHTFLGRFVSYPSMYAHVAHTLWVAHCHAMDAWESTPRLAFLSAEPGSGKTRALEASELLVPNPVEAINVTPAYLFRKVGSSGGRPTILFDEIDTVFGPKAKENEDLRGLLNAGHRKGAMAGRCVVKGKQIETEEIPAYCAVALAGLGNLPDTILSRSVVVRMRRRAPNEKVEPFRRRLHIEEGAALKAELASWAASAIGDVIDAWPKMPDDIRDRDADVWEALLAVADVAGGDWPRRAREAAIELVGQAKASSPSLGVRLLGDLRAVFGWTAAMSTQAMLQRLHERDDAPWGEFKGRPLSEIQLSSMLREYDIKPQRVRIDGSQLRGYLRADFVDAWNRYLPLPSPGNPSHPSHPSQLQENQGVAVTAA
jgi:hypothetical protein